MPNNTQQLIDEAVERFFEEFTYGGVTGKVAFAENKDRPYQIADFFRTELKLIASKSDEEAEQLIQERDYAEMWADNLARRIAPQEVLGEHSNINNPWKNAMEYTRPIQALSQKESNE